MRSSPGSRPGRAPTTCSAPDWRAWCYFYVARTDGGTSRCLRTHAPRGKHMPARPATSVVAVGLSTALLLSVGATSASAGAVRPGHPAPDRPEATPRPLADDAPHPGPGPSRARPAPPVAAPGARGDAT